MVQTLSGRREDVEDDAKPGPLLIDENVRKTKGIVLLFEESSFRKFDLNL